MSLIPKTYNIFSEAETLRGVAGRGRNFPFSEMTTTNDVYGGESEVGDRAYTQQPNETESASKPSGKEKNVSSFPENLGEKDNAHYVKFEVYVIETKNTNLIKNAVLKSKNEDGSEIKPRAQSGKGIASRSGSFSDALEGALGRKYNKVEEMIGLPIPDSVVTDHSTMWSRSEGGMANGLLDLGGMMADEERRKQYDVMLAIANGFGTGITNVLDQLGLEGAQTALQSLTKRVSNPRNEFLFDGVNNRSFNFQWKFIPKSAEENKALHDILEKMKLYMYPELDQATNGAFFLFPAIFDITFMKGSSENEYLYRSSSCALTNMIINYTAAGQWVANHDGSPFGLDVTMQFTETEFLHRARFLTDTNQDGVVR